MKGLERNNADLHEENTALVPEWATGKKSREVYLGHLKDFQAKNEKLIKAEIKKKLRFKRSKQKNKSNDLGY